MSQSPELRAGDSDRDYCIARIREAYAEGRLTSDEMRERLDAAASARTFGELHQLVDDLPPAPALPELTDADRRRAKRGADLRKGWIGWAGVSLMVNVIWAATWISDPGPAPGYWPIWVMGPWGVVMIVSTLRYRMEDDQDG